MSRPLVLAVLVTAACGHPRTSAPSHAPSTHPPGADAAAPLTREPAPPSGAAKEAAFPSVARSTLANGVGLDVVTARALPIVQVRVVIGAGTADAAPAVGELTATMLKDGGTQALTAAELARRFEMLGATLSASADADATVLSSAVAKAELGDALALVSQVVREPRFDEGELKKAKARATDEVEDALASSGYFAAMRVLFRELYPAGDPYATHGALPSEIAKVDGAAIRAFYKKSFAPSRTKLILAGDIDETSAKALVEKHFGAWAAAAPTDAPRATAGASRPPKTRVIVAHRPKSVQSDVFVAMTAPERHDASWPSVRVANQVLGGGVASRLFLDVREQRSLAYRTNAHVIELASGAQPLVVYAGTETSKTSAAVTALLEGIAAMTTAPPTAAETESARRYLADIFAVRMETIGAVADMIVAEETLHLGAGYWDAYRRAVRTIDPAAAAEASRRMYGSDRALVVVSGDADVIADGLARFGDVTVVDPEKELTTVKTIPSDRRPKGGS